MSDVRVLHLTVHFEDDQIWAEVNDLPGCFAAGRNMKELQEALAEAIGFYLAEGEKPASVSELQVERAAATTHVPARLTLATC